MKAKGLPGRLPEGERLLWQGKPEWRGLLRSVFHLRGLAVYFGVILVWSTWNGLAHGAALAELVVSGLRFTGLALVPMALMACYAWAISRSTTYTVTSRRVALHFGVALPMTVNLPFTRIDGANYRPKADGTGDIALQLAAGDKLAYLIMWPHVRPWRLTKPEPMLRAVTDGAAAAQILARALAAHADVPAPVLGQLQDHGQPGSMGPRAALTA